jgi:hypothetical protein
VRALVAGAQDSPDVGRVVLRFRTVRLAQVGPIVERAVTRGQLPQGTNPDDLMRHLAAPLFHRLLVTAAPLIQGPPTRPRWSCWPPPEPTSYLDMTAIPVPFHELLYRQEPPWIQAYGLLQ